VAAMLPPFSGIFQAPIVAALFMCGFYLEGLIFRALAARRALHMKMPGRDRVDAFRNVRSVRHKDRLAQYLQVRSAFAMCLPCQWERRFSEDAGQTTLWRFSSIS
jgi:hypothetical protein